jgi:hypothetical protein
MIIFVEACHFVSSHLVLGLAAQIRVDSQVYGYVATVQYMRVRLGC